MTHTSTTQRHTRAGEFPARPPIGTVSFTKAFKALQARKPDKYPEFGLRPKRKFIPVT